MAIPTTIYVYQEQNNPEAPYRVATTLEELPDGTLAGKFSFVKLIRVVHVVSEGVV